MQGKTVLDTNGDGSAGPPKPSEFQIDLDFQGTWTASQRAALQAAADRWEQIIIGDLPDVTVNGTLIDDLRITSSVSDIDGSGDILAQAGPGFLRTGSFLPATGIMQFDINDIASLETGIGLYEVALHEMGHVLGIGTIWDNLNLLVDATTNNPRFNGATATREYNAIFGRNDASVPVEQDGGPGTRNAHWDEEILKNELMTGFYNGGVTNPLSRITAGSLQDVGYTVDLDAADYFNPLIASARASTSGTPINGYTRVLSNTVQFVTPSAQQLGQTQGRTPIRGDWRSIKIDKLANDRNVAIYLERERPYLGQTDPNGVISGAEFVTDLAQNERSGDEKARLGFDVEGFIAMDKPNDVDIYRFTGIAGPKSGLISIRPATPSTPWSNSSTPTAPSWPARRPINREICRTSSSHRVPAH